MPLTGLQWHVLLTLANGGHLLQHAGCYWLTGPDGDAPERVFPLSFAKLCVEGYLTVDVTRLDPKHWILSARGKAALADAVVGWA